MAPLEAWQLCKDKGLNGRHIEFQNELDSNNHLRRLNDNYLIVSPSELEMLRVRSSEPSARRFASLQAPHVIALECFPITICNELIFVF